MKAFRQAVSIFLAAALVFGLCSFVCAAEDDGEAALAIAYRNVKVAIDGKLYTPKDADGNIVEPFIVDGTTYLPVRAVATALGKNVDWDSSTDTVLISGSAERSYGEYTEPAKNEDVQVTAYFKDIKISVDGAVITPTDADGTPVAPFIMDGTTYLPLRAVASALGKEVSWDSATNTAYIGLQPVTNRFSKTSPATVNTSQQVLFNDGERAFIASVTVTRVYDADVAQSMIYQASALNTPPANGRAYGLCSLTVKVIETFDGNPVNIQPSDFKVYNSSNKAYEFDTITAPKTAFGGSVRAGSTMSGYFAYVVSSNDHSPKMSFGADEDLNGGAWMKLTQF